MDVIKNAHSVSRLKAHWTWALKYRGNRLHLLRGLLAIHAKYVLRQQAERMGCVVEAIGVNDDHIHIALLYPPHLSVSKIKNQLKGASSRILRQRFPWLRVWCPKALWQPGAYTGSYGPDEDVTIRYIENQVRKVNFENEIIKNQEGSA
jgi:putative transposase